MLKWLFPLLLISSTNVLSIDFIKEERKRDRDYYVMSDENGWDITDQCMRTVYYPDAIWRVTEDQVIAFEKMLEKHLDALKKQKAEFIPQSLAVYKRQYIGFESNQQSYIYGNFFPRDYDLEVDPMREAVIVCRSDPRFFGVLFNIDSFRFEAIEKNDKMVKPKGAIDPRMQEVIIPEHD